MLKKMVLEKKQRRIYFDYWSIIIQFARI